MTENKYLEMVFDWNRNQPDFKTNPLNTSLFKFVEKITRKRVDICFDACIR